MNTFTEALAHVCQAQPCADKWLIAPSFQAGTQWLQRLARQEGAALNVRVMTPALLAGVLAEPLLHQRGLTPATGTATFLRTIATWQACQPRFRYFHQVEASITLYQLVANTLAELRLAGVELASVDDAAFETVEKGHDLRLLAAEYARQLREQHAADLADIYALAGEALRSGVTTLDSQVLLCYSSALRLAPHERRLFAALPSAQQCRLPDDAPGGVQASVECYRAVGERNEVRELFRRCLRAQIPLDEVEVLYSESDYALLLAEMAERYQPEAGAPRCLTLAEGLPVRVTRPGRLLQAWLAWLDAGCPQALLLRMLQDKLLALPSSDEGESISSAALAHAFRALPIGFGLARYLPVINSELDALAGQAAALPFDNDDGEVTDPVLREERLAALTRRRQRLHALRETLTPLLELSAHAAGAGQWIEAALTLVSEVARCANQHDQQARLALSEHFSEMEQQVAGAPDGALLRKYLAGLLDSLHVGAESPQPGRLHAAPLRRGGQTGRRHTFIMGLDESRFPGNLKQDPLLLDDERKKISPALDTSVSQLEEKLEEFRLLLSRLRGQLSLSYSCRDLAEDREVFPTPLLLATVRDTHGHATLTLVDFLRDTPVAGHVAASAEACLDHTDWWLSLAMTPGRHVTRVTLAAHVPFLHDGQLAAASRESSRFTEFDGYVPLAGPAHDPCRAEAKPLSPSALETYGKCPLRYFFSRILRIKPPDEYGIDPGVWLDAAQYGTLLHALFQQYLDALLPHWPASMTPASEETRIAGIRERLIAEYRALAPPPSEAVFRRQCRDIADTARLFVHQECERSTQARPLYLEAAIGCAPNDDHPTPLDDLNPVSVTLPNGHTVRFAGRIDRLDQRLHTAVPVFDLWDYKTGGTWAYRDGNNRPPLPFREGRLLQPVIYLAMALARLHAVHGAQATVADIGYYFPTLRGQAEHIAWTPAQLHEGMAIVEHLCAGLAAGAFPATDNAGEDCAYCDYVEACAQSCAQIRRKRADDANVALQAMRTLRGTNV